jgi:hypothetical protein
MAFCISCGKTNLDSAKFCVVCGKSMVPAVSIKTEPIPKPAPPPAAAYPAFPSTNRPNTGLFWILGIIALAGVGLLVYFLTKKDEPKTAAAEDSGKNTKTTMVSNPDSLSKQKDNTIQQPVAVANPQPPATDANATARVQIAEQKVRNYFEANQSRNADLVYSYLNYCTRFYDIYGPTREKIYADLTAYWDRITNISQNIHSIQTEKAGDYLDCFVNMDYSFFSLKDQVDKNIPSLNIKVRLDNNYNIIEIYEISRSK